VKSEESAAISAYFRSLRVEEAVALNLEETFKEMRERVEKPKTLDDALLAVAVEELAKRLAASPPGGYNQRP